MHVCVEFIRKLEKKNQKNQCMMLFFLACVWFLALWAWRNHRKAAWNWPMIGMLPALLLHAGRVHDVCTEVLGRTRRGTFVFRGPWFASMEILGTVNPANVHYITSASFANFPKGPRFRQMFDVLGDGIFNSDSDSWRRQRKVARALITHDRFLRGVAEVSREKVAGGLVPVLDAACRKEEVLDLQEIFQRLTFDTTCVLVTGYDPGCLAVELPEIPFSKAMDDVEEAIFARHLLPESVWKLQRWLGVGSERKLSRARRVLDDVIGKYIAMKREKMLLDDEREGNVGDGSSDLLTSYIIGGGDGDRDHGFLRDTVLNFMIAGRDTTSSALTWFTWLVSTHPRVESKLRYELELLVAPEGKDGLRGDQCRVFEVEETSKLVYLHAALCEALRLYPPVPFQHKEPVEPDILPSGHYVHPKMKVVFFLYAMGRMESIWGKDCSEFKPERWISERGTIRHEPSYKFLAFNAGPRTCLGKAVAFAQMKTVAATLVHNYRVSVVPGHRATPNCSVILYMRDGLKVRVAKRKA